MVCLREVAMVCLKEVAMVCHEEWEPVFWLRKVKLEADLGWTRFGAEFWFWNQPRNLCQSILTGW